MLYSIQIPYAGSGWEVDYEGDDSQGYVTHACIVLRGVRSSDMWELLSSNAQAVIQMNVERELFL